MEEYLGCGDSSCAFDKRSGQCTNAGCRCLDSMADHAAKVRVKRAVARLKAKLRDAERERDEARADNAALRASITTYHATLARLSDENTALVNALKGGV